MQTFLPYPSFKRSAACLDDRRLGKQRVEAKQILLALEDPTYGWQNHPAVKMWRGYEYALAEYGYLICEEWIDRGKRDTLRSFFLQAMQKYKTTDSMERPTWLGNSKFHGSHQANLYKKDPDAYSEFADVPYQPYYWPTQNEN